MVGDEVLSHGSCDSNDVPHCTSKHSRNYILATTSKHKYIRVYIHFGDDVIKM